MLPKHAKNDVQRADCHVRKLYFAVRHPYVEVLHHNGTWFGPSLLIALTALLSFA